MFTLTRLTSIKDAPIIEARTLSSAAGRREAGKLLLKGTRIIGWGLEFGLYIEHVFCSVKLKEHPLLNKFLQSGIRCYQVSEGILRKISNTSYTVPFVGVARYPKISSDIGEFVVFLDGVQDRGNIGTIVRTAMAFGVRDVMSINLNGDLFYEKTIDASRGRVFNINWRDFSSSEKAAIFLRKCGFQIIAASPHGKVLLSEVELRDGPMALVVGNETEGVSEGMLELSDRVIRIPLSASMESLNVGVATGICIYELVVRRKGSL